MKNKLRNINSKVSSNKTKLVEVNKKLTNQITSYKKLIKDLPTAVKPISTN